MKFLQCLILELSSYMGWLTILFVNADIEQVNSFEKCRSSYIWLFSVYPNDYVVKEYVVIYNICGIKVLIFFQLGPKLSFPRWSIYLIFFVTLENYILYFRRWQNKILIKLILY